MNRTMSVVRMHTIDKFNWMILPWIIMFSSFTVNLIIGYFLGGEQPMYTGGIISLFIFLMVIGIITPVQMFPFALGFSVRRKDFFFGVTLIAVLFSAFSAIALLLLSLVEGWTGRWGVNLHFFSLPYVNDGSRIEQFILYFALMLCFFFTGFIISSMYRRFGKSGVFTFFIAIFLLLTIIGFVGNFYGWWLELFNFVSKQTAFQLSLCTIPVTIVCALLSYLMLRKSTI
ncbi:hypothetical protein [Paenibacillus eucommiae]|uniref:ABC transporter permease n=1 Tax=Paenibacillus eucommiae TaxID=1355755 RepID=A0ABS4ISZ3_9BACL|nr:hypothetical protein [Paenibacillus eucommiae]MBP1990643.1 hypothetical protein [Paenibacillus eucommiae]